MAPFSLTSHLLALAPDAYKEVTQAPFLRAAAMGRVPRDVLEHWLANDRLYLHAYIRAAGKFLAELDLPVYVAPVHVPPVHVPPAPAAADSQGECTLETNHRGGPETAVLDWLLEALANVRGEERWMIDVARRYGLAIDLITPELDPLGLLGGPEPDEASIAALSSRWLTGNRERAALESAKLPGLVMMEDIFRCIGDPSDKISPSAAIAPPHSAQPLPWLEGAVTFWATERCYLDAWSWTRNLASEMGRDAAGANYDPDFAFNDPDGGALREEIIPKWSQSSFAEFVGRLADIIDAAVARVVEKGGDQARDAILARVEGKWKSLLVAEAAFWPHIQ